MSSTYTLYNAQQGHKAIADMWAVVKPFLMAGHRMQVTLRKEKRSLPQNAKMWAALTDISKQVDWYGDKLSPEDWKTMLTASLRKQRAVQGIDGGFVVLGTSTSKMTKEEMSELLELAIAFGVDRGVVFND